MNFVGLNLEDGERDTLVARYGDTAAGKAVRAAVGAIEEDRVVVSLTALVRGRETYGHEPAIAVAPVWATKVRLSVNRRRTVRLRCRRGLRRWKLVVHHGVHYAPREGRRWARGTAVLPPIPAALEVRDDMLVAWEADWEMRRRMPHDPAILEHIAGDLWSPVETWDLSEVERLALEG